MLLGTYSSEEVEFSSSGLVDDIIDVATTESGGTAGSPDLSGIPVGMISPQKQYTNLDLKQNVPSSNLTGNMSGSARQEPGLKVAEADNFYKEVEENEGTKTSSRRRTKKRRHRSVKNKPSKMGVSHGSEGTIGSSTPSAAVWEMMQNNPSIESTKKTLGPSKKPRK